jgi:hypothetical protein
MNKNWIIVGALVLVVVLLMFMRGSGPVDSSLEGIHIMEDGTVMLGNGEMAEGASVTADGMIQLSNGDIVSPFMDLRGGESMVMDDEDVDEAMDMDNDDVNEAMDMIYDDMNEDGMFEDKDVN